MDVFPKARKRSAGHLGLPCRRRGLSDNGQGNQAARGVATAGRGPGMQMEGVCLTVDL